MAELITVVVELIALAVQAAFWAVYAVIYAVLRVCGLGGRLPAPRKRSERMSRDDESSNLWAQVLAGVLALAVVGGTIGGFVIYENVQTKREEAATRLVKLHAKRLDLDQDPTPAREPGFLTQAPDPWGQPVRVVYRDHLTHRTVEVRSAGRDGKYDTWDDPVDTRRTLRTAGRVAAPAAKAAGAAAIGGAIKLWQYRENKKDEAIEEAERATP